MASTSPPSSIRSRKRHRPLVRDSLDNEEDDVALDAMLTELGIPRSSSSRHTTPSKASCDTEVIELITPPRPQQSDDPQQNDGPQQSDGPSVVDLTTSPSSPSHGYMNSVEDVAFQEDEQEHEISFSYDPCESPPPFVYSLPSEAAEQAITLSSDDEPEVLSPEVLTARRPAASEKKTRAGAKQARRLSGRLEGLHSETTRATGTGKRRRERTERTSRTASPSRKASASGKAKAAVVTAIVQMEKSLDSSTAGGSIREALKSHIYNGKPLSHSVGTALNCIVPGVLKWERKGAGQSHYSCAIYYEAKVFLEMIQKKGYKELIASVRYIQKLVPKRKTRQLDEEESSKFFVIIQGMDRALVELKRQQQKKQKNGPALNSSSPMITFADLQEVAFQLFMDTGVHTKFTSDLETTADYVALLTREIVVAASRATALEEYLESVSRYNSFRVTHQGGTASASANAWLRMLQVIPGVSEDKAQCLLNHFPTFDSLMCAYRDPRLTIAQKEDLVANKLHDARVQRALSKKIYSVFCEENPDALI